MKKIVVFAGNNPGNKSYQSLAYNTGKILAENGYIVVTGAGPGLMNEVLQGASEANGKTIGIGLNIPGREQSKFAQEFELYDTKNEREDRLIKLADAFLVLPGGIGTTYETFEILIQKKLKQIQLDKPIVLIGEFYTQLDLFLQQIESEKFSKIPTASMYTKVSTIDQALKTLKEYFQKQ